MTDPCEALAALPQLEPPADVLASWHAALAAAPSPEQAPSQVEQMFHVKHRREPARPRRISPPALFRFAAAVLPIATVLALSSADTANAPRALALRADQLATPAALTGLQPPGPPACPSRTGGAHPIGERDVLLDGRPGRLLVLTTDKPGRLRALVLSADCATVLADTLVGR